MHSQFIPEKRQMEKCNYSIFSNAARFIIILSVHIFSFAQIGNVERMMMIFGVKVLNNGT